MHDYCLLTTSDHVFAVDLGHFTASCSQPNYDPYCILLSCFSSCHFRVTEFRLLFRRSPRQDSQPAPYALELPQCFAESLVVLDLSHNQLDSVPPSVCQMLSLQNLNLSQWVGLYSAAAAAAAAVLSSRALALFPQCMVLVLTYQRNFSFYKNHFLPPVKPCLCWSSSTCILCSTLVFVPEFFSNVKIRQLPLDLANLSHCYELGLVGLNLKNIPSAMRKGMTMMLPCGEKASMQHLYLMLWQLRHFPVTSNLG